MNTNDNRKAFSGKLGFVLAAAGSAVGLGNIWRFPYLAARDGGGLFLVVYIILALTFGYTLTATEIAIGRRTKMGPLSAYGEVHHKWKGLGILACFIPMLIVPYYCVIGGWVLKYFIAYITGQGSATAADGYFGGFISETVSPIVLMFIFMAICIFIILRGVDKGIEAVSKILMPILFVLIAGIALFSISLKFTDAEGVTRTGLQGLKIFLIPNLSGLTVGALFQVIVDAMGQLFYSVSVAMGILVAYGSYMPDHLDLSSSVHSIEISDTVVAFLAGVMIIPCVFTYQGTEGMAASGPGLMFISLPKVFEAMGAIGTIVGILFFAMVSFAAITSAVSLFEAIITSIVDEFHVTRIKAILIEWAIALVVAVLVCLGYNSLYFEIKLPNGSIAQILDVLDYSSTAVFMPILAILTCVLIGWVVGPRYIFEEGEKNGHKFMSKKMFLIMIRYIAPVLLLIQLLLSLGILHF